jgi:pyruvate/2-oxoglutarate dehydrogenase complex dihydrolipoamide acyltransferase (E2) component
MSTIIEMPKLSDTMSVGTVVKWHKQVGDKVSNGDILAEIETDKATMELENFEDGYLLKIFVQEGIEVSIGSGLAVVGEEGEEVEDLPTPLKKVTKQRRSKGIQLLLKRFFLQNTARHLKRPLKSLPHYPK